MSRTAALIKACEICLLVFMAMLFGAIVGCALLRDWVKPHEGSENVPYRLGNDGQPR